MCYVVSLPAACVVISTHNARIIANMERLRKANRKLPSKILLWHKNHRIKPGHIEEQYLRVNQGFHTIDTVDILGQWND